MPKTPLSASFVLRTFFRAITGKYGGVRDFVHRARMYFWTEQQLLDKAAAAFCQIGAPDPLSRESILGGAMLPKGPGVYLRLDYWNRLVSGGSYGHTCYVARELDALNPGLRCLMGQQYRLLDTMGVRQRRFSFPWLLGQDDLSLLESNAYSYRRLKGVIARIAPAYIYERAVLGSWAGALIARELRIPYIVEYNGSELTMKRVFDGTGYENEVLFGDIERFVLGQASMISVVSEPVMEDLLVRGVRRDRILVNPNGVDTEAYAPAQPSEKETIRAGLGFSPTDKVIGFIGSFGGWHGIEVLAEALPDICRADEAARFLLIGDGNFRTLLTEAIRRHGLENRVVFTGMVPQEAGARFLKACDIYVSPHSSHMDTGRFFGSPTKLFEYMAMGGGIVASDLEQIGQVLSPGLTPEQAWAGAAAADQRAILCRPADVEDFVSGVSFLLKHPEAARKMGENARKAAVDEFSWKRHVRRLWDFAGGNESACFVARRKGGPRCETAWLKTTG